MVKTVEGVKSDAIFSYLPPLNILAFMLLGPLSYVCSPRTLHRINVFCIRLTVRTIFIPKHDAHDRRASQFSLPSPSMSGGSSGQRGRSSCSLRQVWTGSLTPVSSSEQRQSVRYNANADSLLSSFLGSGSEILISSVFEAAPSMIDNKGIMTPPKASSVASADDGDGDATDIRNDGLSRMGSPLAKIFGRGGSDAALVRGSAAKIGQAAKSMSAASNEEIDGLKTELSEVRASQFRMEEMMAKMLSGGSSGGSGGDK